MIDYRTDGILHVILFSSCILLSSILLPQHFDVWYLALSLVLFKVYQTIGGGGEHVWVTHSLGKPSQFTISMIAIFWLLCGLTRPSFFARYHILHHRHVDTEWDPHSPKYFNKWYLILGLWVLQAHKYDIYADKVVLDRFKEVESNINSNWLLSFVEKYYYIILWVLILVLYNIAPTVLLYGLAIPIVLNMIDGNLFFVYLFHRGGVSRNIPLINYWILGKSGLHKSHHKGIR